MRYKVLEHLRERLDDKYEPVINVRDRLEEKLIAVERAYEPFFL